MSTILFWAGAIVVVLMVLVSLPGTRLIFLPLTKESWNLLKELLEGSWAWLLWIVKSLYQAHAVLFRHLMSKPEEIDPTIEVEKRKD